MALYLVQHGLALPREEDPHKGLSAAGRAQTVRIAEVARGYRVNVAKIYHSGKTRARETAEIFASYLSPPEGVAAREGLGPQDDVGMLAEQLTLDDDWMVVGHLPFLQRLTSYLIIGRPEPAVFMFQNSGVVCVDANPADRRAAIKWALMPSVGAGTD